jgi:hypothetical protein
MAARTQSRTTSWGGTGSANDQTLVASTLAPPVSKPRPKLPAKYMMRLKNGPGHPIANYEDDGDYYWINGLTGSRGHYAKSMIASIDPLPPDPVTKSSAAQPTNSIPNRTIFDHRKFP